MAQQKRWYNSIMERLLRSPLHGVASGSMMILTFTGRRSGSVYSTPVEYFAVGDQLVSFTKPERTWWKNLVGGAPVRLYLRGRDLAATGDARQDPQAIMDAIRVYLTRYPKRAKMFGMASDADAMHDDQALQRAAEKLIAVYFTIASGG